MVDKLLVRMYNVGLGDCIYIRVPDNGANRHILIDCGNTDGDEDLLGRAVDHLIGELAHDPTNQDLDLLVVTHPHQDHIAGFGQVADKFLKFKIKNIWLSASMNKQHPQAPKSLQLGEFADELLEELSSLPLDPAFDGLVKELFALSNKPALTALRETLPDRNGLELDKNFRYVHDEDEPPSLFEAGSTKLHILGPRNDIDSEYLGKIENALSEFTGFTGLMAGEQASTFSKNWVNAAFHPKNINTRDFRRLRERLFKNALAFVLSNSELVNNTSVVLLLEWGGRRLLFPGDAQCLLTRDGQYKKGSKNGSWNVMWHYYHKDKLKDPLDFLKVGHHGSHNATPWVKPNGEEHAVNKIFDTLVPKAGAQKTQVVISTERMKYPTIPDRHLLEELGKRVSTTRKYDEPDHLAGRTTGGKWDDYEPEEILVPAKTRQPLRTDLEFQHTSAAVPFIDIEFEAA